MLYCTEQHSFFLRVKTVWLPQQKLKAKYDETEINNIFLRVKTVWLPQQKLRAKYDETEINNINDALHSNDINQTFL